MNANADNNNAKGRTGMFLCRPKLSFYHPNGRGTGCALQLELHPAHDRVEGSIMMFMANQLTIGSRSANTTVFPRFDWEHRMVIKLSFGDLCKILQVLRGECETIDDGKGLYHTVQNRVTKILFRHILEPVNGYSLDVYRSEGGVDASARILFNSSEALGLCEAIGGSMSVVGFGLPMVINRDTAERDENGGES